MHRKKILQEVEQLISSDRNKTHGDPQENLSLATALKETLRGGSKYLSLTAAEREAADQICTKLSRLVCGTASKEHWQDIAGYAAIGAEARTRKGEHADSKNFYDNLTSVNEDAPMARKVRK